jgi:hypothetical protein
LESLILSIRIERRWPLLALLAVAVIWGVAALVLALRQTPSSPDLMAVLFDGVDKLQHQAWPYVDPAMQGGDLSEFHHRMRALSLGLLKGSIDQVAQRINITFIKPRVLGAAQLRGVADALSAWCSKAEGVMARVEVDVSAAAGVFS